jgi:hypothetical protein
MREQRSAETRGFSELTKTKSFTFSSAAASKKKIYLFQEYELCQSSRSLCYGVRVCGGTLRYMCSVYTRGLQFLIF